MKSHTSIRVHLLTTLIACAWLGCAGPSHKSAKFESPEAAMRATVEAAESDDPQKAEVLFGTDGIELLRSGDEVADHEDAQRIKQLIQEKIAFEERGDDMVVALIGNEGWPFPIPLVRDAGAWSFDVEAGIEEIVNRRIGRNELSTIATMHEYVDAQREYAAQGRDGNPPCFAKRLISSPGKHDGLCWPTANGEPESPLGDLLAEAAADGYTPGGPEPTPYHGYYFRTLDRQGAHAPGGAMDYVDGKGLKTRGFALIAWPAKYGNSGVMTFVVARQGIVYQRDFGPKTEQAVADVKSFDPDSNWEPTSD